MTYFYTIFGLIRSPNTQGPYNKVYPIKNFPNYDNSRPNNLHPSSSSSPQHTPLISPFPLLILLLLPSFHHSSSLPSLFLSNQGVIKKEISNFSPTRSHQSRISIKVLSFLSFCVIDHPSPKISCS